MVASWMVASWMAAPWMAACWIKNYSKTLLRETGCLNIFESLPHITGTSPWFLSPVKVSTSSEHYPDTMLFFYLNAQASSFFNLYTNVTYEIPCHARDHPHPCLWKQTISLGVVIILGIYLCSHTYKNSQNI